MAEQDVSAERVAPRQPHHLVSAGLGVGVGTLLVVTGWMSIGPDHLVFAFVAQAALTVSGFLVGPALTDVLRSRYRVRPFETRLYAALGVDVFRRLLGLIGWNRLITAMRESEARADRRARWLMRGVELSETGHCIGGLATLLIGGIALGAGHPQGALQLVATGIVLHLYPIMVQRLVRSRADRRATGLDRYAG